ncbi:tetratricopeptide repeat protein [Pontibacter sp. 13R65]|uniref:tetratricopeptide repeat protein n=1 Tax=Pontibacter sp. 13R65 TaxID=3127458 RepID=UPI00301D5E51
MNLKTLRLKLPEKILIGLALLTFGLQLLPGFTGKAALLSLSIWALAVSYLFGGYWLLKSDSNEKDLVPILAGVALATSLATLPFTIRLRQETIFAVLPILNATLFIVLGLYLFINRKSPAAVRSYKGIFIRSAIILLIVGFFSYAPVSFKPYRHILIALNNGDEYLVSNLQMFNYTDQFEEALENGDCDAAVEHALMAVQAGKAWLGIDTDDQRNALSLGDSLNSPRLYAAESPQEQDYPGHDQLWKISRAFTNLYEAYTCKADAHFQRKEYEQALQYYQSANKALNSVDHESEYWKLERAFSFNQLGLSYKALSNYEVADSLFMEAVKTYQAVKDKNDHNVAVFFTNVAESFAEQQLYGYSNTLYTAAIAVHRSDSSNARSRKSTIYNYNGLIKNHLQTDSLEQARLLIEESLKRGDPALTDYCDTKLYHGVYLSIACDYRQSDSVLADCLDCYKNLLGAKHQNIAESRLALAKTKMALAEYGLAKRHLDMGIGITVANYGRNSVRYANYLLASAHLNKMLGNYRESENQYHHVLGIYTRELGGRNNKLPEVLTGLSELEVTLAKFDRAKANADSSMAITAYYIDLDKPGLTDFINNAGHVNYSIGLLGIADSLYRKTIEINKRYQLKTSATTATALNGLGLVMAARRSYAAADSLFTRSLMLHRKIFTENHPLTAVVYLNHGSLKIKENKLKEAKGLLTKSLTINKNFFDAGHDIFADTYMAFGDLYKKEKLPGTSKEYYQRALSIYLNKFDEGHLKVILVRQKLGSVFNPRSS